MRKIIRGGDKIVLLEASEKRTLEASLKLLELMKDEVLEADVETVLIARDGTKQLCERFCGTPIVTTVSDKSAK